MSFIILRHENYFKDREHVTKVADLVSEDVQNVESSNILVTDADDKDLLVGSFCLATVGDPHNCMGKRKQHRLYTSKTREMIVSRGGRAGP